jgi:hypothetical protein
MKAVAVLVLMSLFTSFAFATQSPYMPEEDVRFSAVETRATALEALPSNKSPDVVGIGNLRIARFTYDVATNLGTIAAHGLGVSLPAKAIIIRSFFQIDTQFVDGGAGTVALSCEDANNIKTATDITGSSVGAFVEGASTGAASAFVGSIAASCEITATVAGAAQTAGKLTGWVMYVVGS